MKRKLLALILLVTLSLTACSNNLGQGGESGGGRPRPNGGSTNPPVSNDDTSYGDDLEDMGAFDGFFEEETTSSDIIIKCESGTPSCYKLENGTLTFTNLKSDSVYSVSGKLSGNIVIDIGDDYKFELELCGFSLVSDSKNPITVLSGDKVTVQAKKETENYIYDTREAISTDDTISLSGAIHSEVDLEISGKGKLSIVSTNNNGIHSKKDLEVKNLNLTVSCKDNALKGNDSVSLENATAILIATKGDCVKTTNSDISSKGNQRGTILVSGGSYDLYAACDGIDAAYNAVIDTENTVLNIYTDRYSNYSEEVVGVTESNYYIRFNSTSYKYSVKYYNSDSDYLWVNAEYHSQTSGGWSKYYYYSFPKNTNYQKIKFFVYSSAQEQGQEQDYLVASDYITPSATYDTISLSTRGSTLYYDWTNYSTTSSGGRPGGPGGGPGGMMDGNSDKGDHSTKGIKAANEIIINNGTISIKSYDDAIHANNDTTLENNTTPTGNLTVNGGYITVYSNDDGLHADGSLVINGGSVDVINSYEGAEGTTVKILGGYVSIISKDDGINATSTQGTAITIGGGTIYIYCGGDGIDSNSRASYAGIAFTGGNTLIISTSGGNSAIDSEQGYSYSGGTVVAVMPTGGMSNEATKCDKFSSIGKSTNISLTKGQYLVATVGQKTLTCKMPTSLSAFVITLGSSNASVTSQSTTDHNLAEGEFVWE